MKNFFYLACLLVLTNISLTSKASVTHVYLDNTSSIEWFSACNTIDSIIVHKPTNALTGIRWTKPDFNYIWDDDSVIVTSINTGQWYFYSDEVSKAFYVYFTLSVPTEPVCMIHDTSFCTSTFSLPLDAQNQNPGGHAATYAWSMGVSTRIITATIPGTYTVTITNACGVGVYDIIITQANPNAPDLGADQTFCSGSNTVLDPGSTNVATYEWSTGANTPTISVNSSGTYWVDLTDNNGCNGRDTVQITTLMPIGEEICYVEFDTLTWKNNINWTVNLPGNADSVRIKKETSLNVWTTIGTVPKTVTHFLDMASAPQAQSYSYKIAVIDTCGNESNLSTHHTTITLLSAYDAGTNTYGFNWSAYYGLTVSDYYLYGINASNQVIQIASVPGNVYMYNYVTPNLAYIKYFVGFETPSCNAKTNVIVKSNWIQSVITSTHELVTIPFSVYPNPASDQLTINIGLEKFQVEILTMLGQVVLTEHNVKTLDVSNLNQGVYIISVTADGVQTNKIITKH